MVPTVGKGTWGGVIVIIVSGDGGGVDGDGEGDEEEEDTSETREGDEHDGRSDWQGGRRKGKEP
jgi:hypothetical protein